MGKKREFCPPQATVDALVLMNKTIAHVGLRWAIKPPPGRSPLWLQLVIAVLDEAGIPIEGLELRITWRPREQSRGDYCKMNFLLSYHGRRIRGVDTYPFDRYTNRCEVPGLQLDRSLLGPHLHFYVESVTDEEPARSLGVILDPDDINGYWRYFCKECNIAFLGDLPDPGASNTPQMSLEL